MTDKSLKMNKSKISNELLSRVGKYSVLAGASLTVLSGCKKDEESNIVYTDITDVNLTPTVNNDLSHFIDLNADGINDLKINVENYYDNYYGYIDESGFVSADGQNGGNLLTRNQTIDGYNVTFGIGLLEGADVGPAQTIWGASGYLAGKTFESYYNITEEYGDFLGTERYLGVRFTVQGNTHYGWVRISAGADGKSAIIKDYAYHKIPNTPIKSGQKK